MTRNSDSSGLGPDADNVSDTSINKGDFNKDDFILPRYPYRGEFSPEHLAFNANLQEFAARVSLICNLETGGKITSQDAYDQIKGLWKELKASKKNLLTQDQ